MMCKVAAAAIAAVLVLMMMTAASDGSVTLSNTSGQTARPRDPIPYYIVEELPAGTLIGSVPVDAILGRRYDQYQMTLLRYSLVGQKIVESSVAVQLFDIDEVTGIVRTLVQIDRDELCAARLMCLVQLDVLVRPGRQTAIIINSIIKPRSQMRELYAVMLSICSFICLSPETRTLTQD